MSCVQWACQTGVHNTHKRWHAAASCAYLADHGFTTRSIGKRVELHPATDAWMMGDRFGTVEAIGNRFVSVRMDRTGKLRKLRPNYVLFVES